MGLRRSAPIASLSAVLYSPRVRALMASSLVSSSSRGDFITASVKPRGSLRKPHPTSAAASDTARMLRLNPFLLIDVAPKDGTLARPSRTLISGRTGQGFFSLSRIMRQ
ncbi:hypothetical protein amb1973 [Paramagnetospirillum magneticum AMB-1]|uniref:Uncharacterized protein n=1 Tax=Paramagnetospirillum magneticum (strain ATCC 700264 / AMB-1) TaxID=342108 RepID=Q2W5U8_PARM1|nr:hypothetical protein amb1973 [Paramagnetospirillum magneticum AMB-1]